MSKKGFTLIEVLVSIGLLVLIGVVIAISINRVLKNNSESTYAEFVEKVKSSAMLYVNNTPDIINSLNENSFKVIDVKDLIDNGYIKDNLKNPDTGDKIDKNDKVKVSYNSDNELTIDYPYEGSETEPYLYTLNYATTYGSVEDDICYHDLNGSSLQLVKNDNDGAKDHDLVKDTTIKAYMEDGSECSINTSKIGTYKIRYDYTTDNSNISSSNNIKSAERTITVKPSKPVIKDFNATQNDDIYKPTISFKAEDVVPMKYCITLSKDISSCNNWNDVNNNSTITETIDLTKLDSNITSKSTADINLFVKNVFEEYSTNNQNYIIAFTLTVHLNDGKYDSKTTDIVVTNVKYNDKLSKYALANKFSRSDYKFMGLTENADGSGESFDDNSVITKNLTLYAQWYKYCTKTYKKNSECSATCVKNSGTYTDYYYDEEDPNHFCSKENTNKSCTRSNCSVTSTTYDCSKFVNEKEYYGNSYVCVTTGATLKSGFGRVCIKKTTYADGTTSTYYYKATNDDKKKYYFSYSICCYNYNCDGASVGINPDCLNKVFNGNSGDYCVS